MNMFILETGGRKSGRFPGRSVVEAGKVEGEHVRVRTVQFRQEINDFCGFFRKFRLLQHNMCWPVPTSLAVVLPKSSRSHAYLINNVVLDSPWPGGCSFDQYCSSVQPLSEHTMLQLPQSQDSKKPGRCGHCSMH